jgi:tetratricopeptide (TPR) repeat protein
MRNKLILLLLAAAISIANAVTLASSAKSSPSANASGSFNITDCWNNREVINNQEIIADYLMNKPDVPTDFEAAWKTARLVYFIGNYGAGEKRFVDTNEGVILFDYGAKAGLLAQTLNPNAVEGYYWYGIDLGSYGLAKGILSAAASAKDGMKALKKAQEINPSYQWYGSNRILGRYYQELPGLFGGDSEKALALMISATKSAPAYRNNWLFLGQYYLSDGKYDKATLACNKALGLSNIDGKFEEIRYIKEAKQCVAKAKAKLS